MLQHIVPHEYALCAYLCVFTQTVNVACVSGAVMCSSDVPCVVCSIHSTTNWCCTLDRCMLCRLVSDNQSDTIVSLVSNFVAYRPLRAMNWGKFTHLHMFFGVLCVFIVVISNQSRNFKYCCGYRLPGRCCGYRLPCRCCGYRLPGRCCISITLIVLLHVSRQWWLPRW